jgi:histidine triad (HIT) family protein
MTTIFTRIIDGELPGRFVWRDERCVAFLSINPLAPGHTLVVPRVEVDHWIDVPADLMAHLTGVSRTIGLALQEAFQPVKVALLIVGEEVPHAHLHLVPFHRLSQLSFASAERDPDPAMLDDAADRIRRALRDAGHPDADAMTEAD